MKKIVYVLFLVGVIFTFAGSVYASPKAEDTAAEQIPVCYEEKHAESKYLGSISIESIGIAVDVYTPVEDISEENLQAIVDMENSALICSTDGMLIIADHASQGFSVLSEIEPGDELVYVNHNNRTFTYICTDIYMGNNYGSLYREDGTPMKDFGCDLVVYTCQSSDGITVWIAEFEQI